MYVRISGERARRSQSPTIQCSPDGVGWRINITKRLRATVEHVRRVTRESYPERCGRRK